MLEKVIDGASSLFTATVASEATRFLPGRPAGNVQLEDSARGIKPLTCDLRALFDYLTGYFPNVEIERLLGITWEQAAQPEVVADWAGELVAGLFQQRRGKR